MSNLKSIMTDTDSYKGSMFVQYPPGTEYVFSYIESRGGKYDRTEFLGVQRLVQYLAKPITQEQIDFAETVWTANGMPFNREGWEYILKEHNGYLPLCVRAAKEGLLIPVKNVLCTIENTDPKVPWLTTWVETAALRAIWYPTTVGTISWHVKQVIKSYLEKSGDVAGLPFKLHDFGARGVSSSESAEIGGSAHLVNFMGTDTIASLIEVNSVYGDDIGTIGYSIPASEHSTITSWGRDSEKQAYANMVKQFAKPGAIFAVVSDSYDIYEACKMWGSDSLYASVVTSGATLVIRPDSGDPVVVLPKMLKTLSELYGTTKNDKGYKVLNTVRIIWGDGINAQSLESILRTVVDVCGYSADNFAFGMGGGLLQQLDRDTQKFAMKCSSIGIRERFEDADKLGGYYEVIWRDVFKDPITDPGKASKKGRISLFTDAEGYYTGKEDWLVDELETYYEDGEIKFTQTFAQVRANSEL